LEQIPACGSMVLSIFCVQFFRALRGKTAHQQQLLTRALIRNILKDRC
jgi:hypothetical protein